MINIDAPITTGARGKLGLEVTTEFFEFVFIFGRANAHGVVSRGRA